MEHMIVQHMNSFSHPAQDLPQEKTVVFTAQSCKNFHQRMLICQHAFNQGVVPINPFNTFGYFLYELVSRDLVRNANNNLLKRCDELWVYGEVSDGMLVEILTFQKSGKPIRFFDINQLPEKIIEVLPHQVLFEKGLEEHAHIFHV